MDRFLKIGSSGATLFITVLFLPPLTESFQYQLVIKDQSVPGDVLLKPILVLELFNPVFMPARFLYGINDHLNGQSANSMT